MIVIKFVWPEKDPYVTGVNTLGYNQSNPDHVVVYLMGARMVGSSHYVKYSRYKLIKETVTIHAIGATLCRL